MTDLDKIKYYLDNTAPISRYKELGLFRFAKDQIPEAFPLEFGRVHYRIANDIFRLYDPIYTSRMERQAYTLVHRGAAKTTLASFLFSLFSIFMKNLPASVRLYNDGWEGGDGVNNYKIIDVPIGEKFIMIISETSSSAENFVTNIKNVIDNMTPEQVALFGDKHGRALQMDQEVVRRGESMWRQNAFITSDKTIVYGIGSGQQVRGRNVLNTRPTLAIIDDMYSEKNTKTEEARRKLDNWFYAAMKNSIDIKNGKVLLLGTMVHPDTVFKDIRKSDLWHGTEIPLIEEQELQEVLKLCVKKGIRIEIPSKEKCKEIERGLTTLSWRENYDLHAILGLYKEMYEKGREQLFYQEYLNVIKRDAERSIDAKVFVECEMSLRRNRMGQAIIVAMFNGREWEATAEMYIGVDIASSSSKASDDTVLAISGIAKFRSPKIGVTGYDYVTLPYIWEIDGGKLSIFSQSAAESPDKKERLGWANKLEHYAKVLPISMATVEVAGQTETIFNEVYAYMQRKGVNLLLKPETPSNQMKKEERIMSIMMPVVQRYHRVLVNKNCVKKDSFYGQLEYLGSDGMHDDYPDGMAYSWLYMREPQSTIVEAEQKSYASNLTNKFSTNSWEVM